MLRCHLSTGFKNTTIKKHNFAKEQQGSVYLWKYLFFSDADLHVWELRGPRFIRASWNSSARHLQTSPSRCRCKWMQLTALLWAATQKSLRRIASNLLWLFFFVFFPLASLYESIVMGNAPAEREWERERKEVSLHLAALLHRPHNQSTSPLLLLLFSPHFHSVSRQLLVPAWFACFEKEQRITNPHKQEKRKHTSLPRLELMQQSSGAVICYVFWESTLWLFIATLFSVNVSGHPVWSGIWQSMQLYVLVSWSPSPQYRIEDRVCRNNMRLKN